MNSSIRKLLYSLTRKRIDESKLDVIEISVKEEDVSYFFLSTNTIASFTCNGELFYFRDCPEILPFDSYVRKSTELFFYYLKKFGFSKEHFSQAIPIRVNFNDAEISSFRQYIDEMLKTPEFLKTVSKADIIAQNYGFNIWEQQEYTDEFFNCFGFNNLDTKLRDIALCYLWYIRSTAASFRSLGLIRGDKYSYLAAVKMVASKIVADELKLSDFITDARFCRLSVGDREPVFGILSSSAAGNRMADVKIQATPELQRQLNLLNALDIICFQKDHGPNNYNVTENFTVCAFDNDNPSTFLPIPFAFMSMSCCSQMVDVKGNMLRPYFDKTLYETLINLDIKKLKSKLRPYLNSFQISALISRIKMLRKAVSKTIKSNNGFLLDTMDWNTKTIDEELSGKYGITYLLRAINK